MEPHLAASRPGLVNRLLGSIERIGNKLPDPAMLFLVSLFVVWGLSALLAPVGFADLDPRTGEPIRVVNLLTGTALAAFLANMVDIFTSFAPLGVVLVAMLGVGVADEAGVLQHEHQAAPGQDLDGAADAGRGARRAHQP